MTLTFTPDEQETLNEIRRAGGFRTDEDVVRGALFWFGRFMDVSIPADIFALSPLSTETIQNNLEQPDLLGEP
jgi:hypothetical protein